MAPRHGANAQDDLSLSSSHVGLQIRRYPSSSESERISGRAVVEAGEVVDAGERDNARHGRWLNRSRLRRSRSDCLHRCSSSIRRRNRTHSRRRPVAHQLPGTGHWSGTVRQDRTGRGRQKSPARFDLPRAKRRRRSCHGRHPAASVGQRTFGSRRRIAARARSSPFSAIPSAAEFARSNQKPGGPVSRRRR